MKVTNIIIVTDEGTTGTITPDKLQLVQTESGTMLGIPNDDGTSMFPIVQFAVNLAQIEPAPEVTPEPEKAPEESSAE